MFRLGIPEAVILLVMCALPMWLFVLLIRAMGVNRKIRNILVASLMLLVFSSVSGGLLTNLVGQTYAPLAGLLVGAVLAYIGWRQMDKRPERQNDER